ncbi:10171_t:CDS:2, partial [Funneliformis caledonium]
KPSSKYSQPDTSQNNPPSSTFSQLNRSRYNTSLLTSSQPNRSRTLTNKPQPSTSLDSLYQQIETSSQSFSRTPSQSFSRTPSQQSMMTSDIIIKYHNINIPRSYQSSHEEVTSHQPSHESYEEEA